MNGESNYDWRTDNKLLKKGYVCITKCGRGFKWYNSVQKCLRVVPDLPDTKKSLPMAMIDCQTYNGRLFSTKDCDQLNSLRQEMLGPKEIIANQEYFLGHFAGGFGKSWERRRSKLADNEINSYVIF